MNTEKKIALNDQSATIGDLRTQVEAFVTERDWTQFHSLKNLSMAIAVEAAELMEHFMWDNENSMEDKRTEIEHELADIIIASFAFANRCNIDVTTALLRKLDLNKKKYPIEKAKGQSDKYTAYQNSSDTQK
jgi:NTP pyrophosphatase (non-canonical NTP hydrolase)